MKIRVQNISRHQFHVPLEQVRAAVVKKRVLATIATAICSLFMIGFVPSSAGSTGWGSINNFDAVNDTGDICHGFEIEINGIRSRDISYTYDWNHYGVPRITEDITDPSLPKVFVRYESAKNADGTWVAYTAVPSGPIAPTDGHQFTDPTVNFGGEHFGVGYFGAPTAVKYSWLKDNGAGQLVFAGAVNIATPTFNYFPPAPAAPAIVVAAIVPPPPPEPPTLEFGPACWVKEIKTTSHNTNKVEIRDLVTDDPNDPNDRNWQNGEAPEIEIEWRLLQTKFSAPDGGANGELVGAPEELPDGDEIITRRYEFFKYTGPFDAESGEAMASEVGSDGVHGVGTVSYNDHIDPQTREWVVLETDLTTVAVVGDYIGAQMAGFDAAAQIGLIDHLQDGEINVPYIERTIVIGGNPPIATTLTGALPNGMSFDEVSGVLTGTPTVTGTFTFDVRSTDAVGGDVTATYHLTIIDSGAIQPVHVTVSTVASPTEGGTVSGGGEFVVGDLVTLNASAQPAYAFVNWTDGGTLVSVDAAYQFTATVNRELVATFVPTYDITTTASPISGGTTAGDGNYRSGNIVTVTATPDAAYRFVNWTEGPAVVSASADYHFSVAGNRALTANFTLKAPILGILSATATRVKSMANVTVVIENTGDASADAVAIDAKKDATLGRKTSQERSPVVVGTIAPGATAAITLGFTGVKSGTTILKLTLTHAGGVETLSVPVIVP
jgi:hypothetical protein